MFTWWIRHKHASASATDNKFRPHLETLEERVQPIVSIKAVTPVVNASQAAGNQTEQSIAVNPRNTNQVFVASNNDAPGGGIFTAWSDDAGVSWNTQIILNDPTLPEEGCCDPQLAWDQFGNLFMTYLTLDGEIGLGLSTDGGQNFSVQVITSTGSKDQPSIAVGPGPRANLGSVWVCYADAAAVPSRVVVQRAVVAGFGLVGAFNTPGVVGPYGDPSVVPGSDAVQGNFGDIAVGPNGQVMVTYQSLTGNPVGPSVIWVNVDPDGLGRLPFGPRRSVTTTNVGGFRVPANGIFPAQANLGFGIDAEASLAWDRSTGPNRGRVYMVYTDAPTALAADTNSDIYMRFSDNNGLTWSPRVRINDDVGTTSQFNNAVAVDPTSGSIAIAWYDARNDPGPDTTNNRRAEFWVTISNDGGATFAPQFVVSSAPSDSQRATVLNTAFRQTGFGDYNKIDFTNGVLQLAWSDNSSYYVNGVPANGANGLEFNPDVDRMDVATRRYLVAPALKVRVYFPPRWTPLNAAAGLYTGQLRILNTSGINIQGPFTLTITLPATASSINFVSPTNTKVGNTVTFTITSNLVNKVPLLLPVQISNPLKVKLPSVLIGYATTIL